MFTANLTGTVKVTEIKAAPESVGGDQRRGSCDSREAETELPEDGPSSLYPEELRGFTSASEMYSVRALLLHFT